MKREERAQRVAQAQDDAATRIATAQRSRKARGLLASKREHQRLVDEAEADRVLLERAAKREAATKVKSLYKSLTSTSSSAEFKLPAHILSLP